MMSLKWVACVIANAHAMIVQHDAKAEEIATFLGMCNVAGTRHPDDSFYEVMSGDGFQPDDSFYEVMSGDGFQHVKEDMKAYVHAFVHGYTMHLEDSEYERCIRRALYLDGGCPLHLLAIDFASHSRSDRLATARFLLDGGFYPDGADGAAHELFEGRRPLQEAVDRDFPALVKLLLEYGASLVPTPAEGDIQYISFFNEVLQRISAYAPLSESRTEVFMLLLHNGATSDDGDTAPDLIRAWLSDAEEIFGFANPNVWPRVSTFFFSYFALF